MSDKFRVTLTDSEILMAEVVGRTRTSESRKKGLKEGFSESNEEHEYRERQGVLGEMAVAKALNVFFPGHVNTFKTLADVYRWEVRTISETWHHLIIRPGDKLDRIYVLVCVQSPHCWVKGYFDAKDLKVELREKWKKDYNDLGKPLWEIPNDVLKDCSDLLEDIAHPDPILIHDESWDDEWKGPSTGLTHPFRHSTPSAQEDFGPFNLPGDNVIRDIFKSEE